MDKDKNDILLKEHVRLMLEQVGKIYAKWPVYQDARDKVVELLRAGEEHTVTTEDRVAWLTDCETAITIVAYYMGMQEGFRWAQRLDSDRFIQTIMDAFSQPFTEVKE